MKLAAIAKIIKQDKCCKLYRAYHEESSCYDLYIGTKTGIYPLTGFPKPQDEQELATLLGIGENDWLGINFDVEDQEGKADMSGLDLQDAVKGEKDCINGRIGIRYCGYELLPLIEPDMQTVGFIDIKLLGPVADEVRKHAAHIKYSLRRTASGGRYYVVKDGLIVRAAVLPFRLESLGKQELKQLADMVMATKDTADIGALDELDADEEDENDG